jgi:hypothetical protein
LTVEVIGAGRKANLRQSGMSEKSLPTVPMPCRPHCGACCIAPSISSLNKPAGVPCRHLDEDFRCRIFGSPERPDCCAGLQASAEMCGLSREHALNWLAELEVLTHPG